MSVPEFAVNPLSQVSMLKCYGIEQEIMFFFFFFE